MRTRALDGGRPEACAVAWWIAPLLGVALVTACFPVLPVSPAVQPGVRSGAAASLQGMSIRASSLDDSTRTKGRGMFHATAYSAVGVRGPAHLPAGRATFFVTTGLGFGFEGFLQAPKAWTGGWDAGGGGLVQAGLQDASGWSASIGHAVPRLGYGWMSGGAVSLAARRDGRRHRVLHFMAGAQPRAWRPELRAFAGAVVGPQDERCGTDPRSETLFALCPPVTRFYLGVGAEASARALGGRARR